MIRMLRHDDTVHREDDGIVRFDDLAEMFKSRFAATSQWSIEAWITFLAKGGGPMKRFQYCLIPNSSEHFLYFRAIQGHSGGTLVHPTLQDNVLLPNDFAEYIYHLENAHDMHTLIRCGVIPGGRSLKRDRQSVIFTAVNPMYANQDLEDVQYDLDKPRITLYKNTWRVHPNTVFWCSLMLAQRKGLQFYQTRSHAIALFDTLHAICFEKVVYMKTGEDVYCKVYQSSRLPRVVLTPNLHYGRQDLSNPEARTSADHQSEQSAKHEEIRRGKITEFKEYLTQQFRKKTLNARKS